MSTVLCLDRQRVPPTPGEGEIDPAAPVNLIREPGLTAKLETAASLSLGFGGNNGALVLARWRG